MTGNFMIDGDNGSDSRSPFFKELPHCPLCNGCGLVPIDSDDLLDTKEDVEYCSMCDGTGEISWEDHKDFYSND